MKFLILTGLIAVTMIASCKMFRASNEKTDPEPEWVPWMLKYERGPCFGQCPVYTFYLLSDGSGLVESRYNLLEPGWYHAVLDQEAVHEILNDIEPESWWDENLSEEPQIADLPGMSMLYKHENGLRWFSIQGRISDRVAKVFQKVEHLVSEGRWQITKMRPLDPDVPEPTDVIVQLKEGVDIHTWMKKYEQFGIRLKSRVAPQLQYYVVSKVAGMGAANDFLQYIKLDEEVIDAQWDSELSPRN